MTHSNSRDEPSKVVIVEDEPALANLFAAWLGETHTVEVANDCENAYKLFDESIDVALLDRQLPDGSGDEVLTELRKIGLDCRVAMVTAVEPDFDILAMGFDDYLTKPVSQEELRSVVERLLAQANYGDAISQAYVLASKKALLETHCSAMELAASEEFAALEARIEELDRELDSMVNMFSEEQITAEFTRLSSEGIQG